jgi:hypothetical protein
MRVRPPDDAGAQPGEAGCRARAKPTGSYPLLGGYRAIMFGPAGGHMCPPEIHL